MNKQASLSLLAGVLATGAIAAFQPSANAASFTASDAAGCVGLSSCTVNGFFDLTASTTRKNGVPKMTQKNVGGILGIGIDSSTDGEKGKSEGEIDADETLKVKFDKAGVLDSLVLSFLYPPENKQFGPVYWDEVFEVALVAADGILQKGKLTVTGNTSATWDFLGTVTNLDPSKRGDGGSYRISNPFGDTKITGFSLTAVTQPKWDNLARTPGFGKNSDFALTEVNVSKVPEPAAVAGLGLFGLLAATRRRKAVKAS